MTKRDLARVEYTDSATMVNQIREIATLIAKGKWQMGVTELRLAKKYGVSVPSIRHRAAEARRVVQNAYGDTEDLRTDIIAQLNGIAHETRRKEPRTAVSALMGIAAVTGLVVTHRQDTREPKLSRHLSPTERRKEIARIQASLAEADEQARLEEEGIVDMVPDVSYEGDE